LDSGCSEGNTGQKTASYMSALACMNISSEYNDINTNLIIEYYNVDSFRYGGRSTSFNPCFKASNDEDECNTGGIAFQASKLW
jgi:hypothetical protein